MFAINIYHTFIDVFAGPLVSNLTVTYNSIEEATVIFDAVPRVVTYSVVTYSINTSLLVDNSTLTVVDEVDGKVTVLLNNLEADFYYITRVTIRVESTNGINLESPEASIAFQTGLNTIDLLC